MPAQPPAADHAAQHPYPAAPRSALIAARLGGSIALAAAACISFTALRDLAHQAGLNRLVALLPIAVDAFAASSLFVAYRLPRGHPARRTTGRTARLALALTIACNSLDHLLDLAGYLLTPHIRDLLLVAVASLPPLIVERLLHLQSVLVGDAVTGNIVLAAEVLPGDSNAAGDEQMVRMAEKAHLSPVFGLAPADGDESAPAVGQNAEQAIDDSTETGKVTGHPRNTGRAPSADRSADGPGGVHRVTDERWLAVAVPVYKSLVASLGHRPSETAFHVALSEALTVQADVMTGHDDYVAGHPRPAKTLSLSTAKRVRALVEGRNAQSKADAAL